MFTASQAPFGYGKTLLTEVAGIKDTLRQRNILFFSLIKIIAIN
jgi:superfamily II helicase